MHACGALACRKNTHIHKIKTKQILIRITRWRNEKKSKAVRRQLSPSVYEGFFKKPQTWDARWVFITYLNGTITSLIYRLSTLASTPWFISTHPLLITQMVLEDVCSWTVSAQLRMSHPRNLPRARTREHCRRAGTKVKGAMRRAAKCSLLDMA